MNDHSIESYYELILNIWKNLVDLHNELYKLTCQEYDLLLKNDITQLDVNTQNKDFIIKKIDSINLSRKSLIDNINKSINTDLNLKKGFGKNILNVFDLLTFFTQFDLNRNNTLYQYNKLLIEIIETIQFQNKKNHMMINKSLANIKSIRAELIGKSYNIYNNQGMTKNLSP